MTKQTTRRTFSASALAMATLACAPAIQAVGALLSPPDPLVVRLQSLTPDGRDIVETCARLRGCRPTDFTIQQINLIIGQAELMGEL